MELIIFIGIVFVFGVSALIGVVVGLRVGADISAKFYCDTEIIYEASRQSLQRDIDIYKTLYEDLKMRRGELMEE